MGRKIREFFQNSKTQNSSSGKTGPFFQNSSSEFLSPGNFQIPRTQNSCRKERSNTHCVGFWYPSLKSWTTLGGGWMPWPCKGSSALGVAYRLVPYYLFVLWYYDFTIYFLLSKWRKRKFYLHGLSVSSKSDHRFGFSTLFQALLLIQIFSNISTFWNISIPRYWEVKKSHFTEI